MENEKRLIDANALQKTFEGLKEKDGHATGRNAYDLCAMLTEDAPTIDAVEVVHGQWTDDQYMWECNQCHAWLEVTQGTADMNYCPNCGADMRERECNERKAD